MAVEILPSVCPHDCPGACSLEVERLAPDRIGRVRGASEHPYTDGVVCAKVARYAERVHHPDRLRTPLRRTGPKGSGQFEPISWDEALDTVAAAFQEKAFRYGSETVWPYFYGGTMGQIQRSSINCLRHIMKYSRQATTICSTIGDAGWTSGVGAGLGVDPREMAVADLIVVWGMNPVATQINVMAHITKARKTRGARLVVIDPWRTATAAVADLHLAPRPGTDGALACAVMHVLFREGLADRDYLARYTDVPEALEHHLESRTPAWAAAITGISADDIEDFAKLYGNCKRSFIRFGIGMTRQRNGAANLHAASCLPAVTGAWAVEGGGALFGIAGVFRLNKIFVEGLDHIDNTVRVLDMCQLGRILTGDAEALKGGPPVSAMLVQSANPAVTAPESLLVRQGLLREDLFLCVHEQFMTDTAAMADVVLPATTFLEHDDLYRSYGQTFMQSARAVITPQAEARSNHDMVSALALRLGVHHESFTASAWELADRTLKASDYPGADEHLRWRDYSRSFRFMHFLDGFPTVDGKFHFAGKMALPDHLPIIEDCDTEHSFRLITAPSQQFLNSTFSETSSSRTAAKRPTALIHPEDGSALGIADGDRVRLGNRRGSVVVHAALTDAPIRGIIVVEGLWPNKAFEEGIGINALVGADAVLPTGGAAFHDTAIWLRRA